MSCRTCWTLWLNITSGGLRIIRGKVDLGLIVSKIGQIGYQSPC